jgi:type II secretory pathway pseudopilin PulG
MQKAKGLKPKAQKAFGLNPLALSRAGGFTLVEVVVTAAFTATAIAAIIGIFITVGKLNKQARNLAVATQIAQQKLETYRNKAYPAVAIGTPAETFTSELPANFGSPKAATATVAEIESGLKKVDINITYTDDRRLKHVDITTYITERGIDR